MSSFHEQLASNAYWEGPVADHQAAPLILNIANIAFHGNLSRIDETHKACMERGSNALPLQQGDELPYLGVNQVLKLIEDVRLTPKRPEKLTLDDVKALQEFDTTAQEMLETHWYGGLNTSACVQTPGGIRLLSRRVSYAVNPLFGDWPLAKTSSLLGHDGGPTAHLVQPRPIGTVTISRNRAGVSEQRLASAELLSPAGRKRSALRLPAALFGNANPLLGNA